MSEQVDPKQIEEAKGIAWISYLGILFVIPLFTMKDNPFARHHARQGMTLFGANLALLFVCCCVYFAVTVALSSINELLGSLWGLVATLGWLAAVAGPLVLAVMGIVKSLGGEMWEMPILGGIAKKIKI